jgi:hypothetical protein
MLNPGAALIGIAFTLVHPQQQTLARQSAPSTHAVVLATTSLPGNTVMQVSPSSSSASGLQHLPIMLANPNLGTSTGGVQNLPIMLANPNLGPSTGGVQNIPIMHVDPPARGVGSSSAYSDLPVMRVEPPIASPPPSPLKGSQQ